MAVGARGLQSRTVARLRPPVWGVLLVVSSARARSSFTLSDEDAPSRLPLPHHALLDYLDALCTHCFHIL